MADRRHPNVVSIEEVAPEEQGRGKLGFRRRRLGHEAGGKALGCSHLEVAPGKTAFPYHFHTSHEEAIYVLEGEGMLRIGQERVDVRPGDYVSFQPGPEGAHALTNTGKGALRYLAMSAPAVPLAHDIVGYPDSKKIAFAAGIDPLRGMRSAWLTKIVKEDQPTLDYYDDEPLARE